MKKSSFGLMTDEERLALASRIKEMVDAAGSQPVAAKMAGVSKRQIGAYVAGESAPPLLPIARLAAGVAYDLNWVIGGTGEKRLRPIEGELDILAGVRPESAKAADNLRRRTSLARRVTNALNVAYADLGVQPSQADLQNAALTIATLVLDVPRMREDEVDSAAAEFAVQAHRQAHRLAKASVPSPPSPAKKRA